MGDIPKKSSTKLNENKSDQQTFIKLKNTYVMNKVYITCAIHLIWVGYTHLQMVDITLKERSTIPTSPHGKYSHCNHMTHKNMRLPASCIPSLIQHTYAATIEFNIYFVWNNYNNRPFLLLIQLALSYSISFTIVVYSIIYHKYSVPHHWLAIQWKSTFIA